MNPARLRVCLIGAWAISTLGVFAQGTAFTYQGRLDISGAPANGSNDLTFTLYDALNGGGTVGTSNVVNDLVMSNGLFTVTLDFGAGSFDGTPRWLQIAARPGASPGAYTNLSPRTPITPTPYALYAGGANASGLTGTLPAGALAGVDGGGLTNLNVNNLAGTMADAQLSANVALRTGGNTFSGNQIITDGKVGIGTNNGPWQLHVVGVPGTSRNGIIAAETTDSQAGPQLRLKVGGSGEQEWVFVANGEVNGPVGDFQIVQQSGGSRMVITTNGNVGIGTTTPSDRLQVLSTNNVRIRTSTTGTGYAGFLSENSAANWFTGPIGPDGTWYLFQNAPNLGGVIVVQTNRLLKKSFPSEKPCKNPNDFEGRIFKTCLFQQPANKHVGIGVEPGIARLNVNHSWPNGVGVFLGDRTPFGVAAYQTDYSSNNVTHAWFAENGARVFSVMGGNGYFAGNVGIGTSTPATRLHVSGTITANELNCPTVNANEITTTAVNITSDRNAKEQFRPVNAREVLDKVTRLPISEWQYKTQGDVRHLGPMAQDFHEAFALGRDDKHITSVDADGVALAAIQGLNEKLEEKSREVEALKANVAALTELVNQFAARRNGGAR